jgi:glucose/arabinose dehydrogenase
VEPQGGYKVIFQPLSDGEPAGDFKVFADGFAGKEMEPGSAEHRPSGVAVGPDGSLIVTDDQEGRVWRLAPQGRAT